MHFLFLYLGVAGAEKYIRAAADGKPWRDWSKQNVNQRHILKETKSLKL